MHKYLYLTGIEKTAGKSFISSGLLAVLKEHAPSFHCFKLFSEPDNSQIPLLEALTEQNITPVMPINTAIAMMREDPEELFAQVLKNIEGRPAELNYFEGSDFQSDNDIFEYEFNLRLAYQLNCDLLLVISAKDRTLKHTLSLFSTAMALSKKNHAQVAALIINRVPLGKELAFKRHLTKHFPHLNILIIPEFEQLTNPSVADIAKKLNAEIICGQDELQRNVKQLTVAAKTIGNFLESRWDRQGMLIITPDDRIDILLGTLLADHSANYPKIAGIVLTGGKKPPPAILKLINGLDHSFPVLLTHLATYETATLLYSANYHLSTSDMSKVKLAIDTMQPYLFAPVNQLLSQSKKIQNLNPSIFLYELNNKAQALNRHIVLPEGHDPRILRAADYLLKRRVVKITLLGQPDKIHLLAKRLQLDLPDVHIIDIEIAAKKEYYAEQYFQLRQHKNVNYPIALERMNDVNYFAVMMVYCGDADGIVSGAEHTTADTVRPALEIIKTKPGATKVSSVFIMCMPTRVLIYGDCAINPNPDSKMLAEITFQAVEISKRLGIEPRVALLSYSSGDSGKGESVEKVSAAMRLIRKQDANLLAEGPIQYDAAVEPEIAAKKLPHSQVAGNATILIFPDLNTGNNTYKAVQRESGALAIGPVLLGLNKPVNDLSRGCTVQDIINTILVTAIQTGEEDDHFNA